MSTILENYSRIRQSLEKVGRSDVQIMAVSKRQPLSHLQAALQAGVKCFGVNYTQEGQWQMESLGRQGIAWHFIGHIQSRKAKGVADYDMVQSLDRIEVAEKLASAAEALGKKLPVLVEINIGRESGKSGVLTENLEPFLQKLSGLSSLVPSGLMVMPPPLPEVEARRPFFQETKRLYDLYAEDFPFHTLSMGTSEDYLVAVTEGATLIRLGSLLLGNRPELAPKT